MTERRPTLYASRRIRGPVPVVAAEVDSFLARRDRWTGDDGARPTRSGTTPTFSIVLRRASGRKIARVEVEVVRWSEGTTEVGLRPLGRRARRAATTQTYSDAAAALLDALVSPLVGAAAPHRTSPLLLRAS